MGVITKEELENSLSSIKKIQEEIRQFIPIVSEYLQHLAEEAFKATVCYGNINNRVREAFEGDFLYQCSLQNRRYFDAKNRENKTQGDIEREQRYPYEKPTIDVNVVGLAKFAIDCPYEGEFICKLKNFVFESKEKDAKSL